MYRKTRVKRPRSKRPKIGFQDQLLPNAGPNYYRMPPPPPVKNSAILSTFMKLPIAIKIFILSIVEWPFYTGFTVLLSRGLAIFTVSLHQTLASLFLSTLH